MHMPEDERERLAASLVTRSILEIDRWFEADFAIPNNETLLAVYRREYARRGIQPPSWVFKDRAVAVSRQSLRPAPARAVWSRALVLLLKTLGGIALAVIAAIVVLYLTQGLALEERLQTLPGAKYFSGESRAVER